MHVSRSDRSDSGRCRDVHWRWWPPFERRNCNVRQHQRRPNRQLCDGLAVGRHRRGGRLECRFSRRGVRPYPRDLEEDHVHGVPCRQEQLSSHIDDVLDHHCEDQAESGELTNCRCDVSSGRATWTRNGNIQSLAQVAACSGAKAGGDGFAEGETLADST